MDAHTDNVKTVYPPQTKFAEGIITSDVIAYHLVHFFTICVIHKCQSGIDFFLLVWAQKNSSFMDKISMTSQVFSGKNMEVELAMCVRAININKRTRLPSEVW